MFEAFGTMLLLLATTAVFLLGVGIFTGIMADRKIRNEKIRVHKLRQSKAHADLVGATEEIADSDANIAPGVVAMTEDPSASVIGTQGTMGNTSLQANLLGQTLMANYIDQAFSAEGGHVNAGNDALADTLDVDHDGVIDGVGMGGIDGGGE